MNRTKVCSYSKHSLLKMPFFYICLYQMRFRSLRKSLSYILDIFCRSPFIANGQQQLFIYYLSSDRNQQLSVHKTHMDIMNNKFNWHKCIIFTQFCHLINWPQRFPWSHEVTMSGPFKSDINLHHIHQNSKHSYASQMPLSSTKRDMLCKRKRTCFKPQHVLKGIFFTFSITFSEYSVALLR